MSFTRFRFLAITALSVLLLAMPLILKGQSPNDSAQVNELLSQAKATAYQVSTDADKLASYTHSGLSWQTHARQLEQMRTHVNELGEDVSQLTALRSQGSPWQQEAIDRINPLLKSMADHLTNTIQHLNDNQARIHLPAYQDYARGNRVFADKTFAVIRDFVDYSEALAEADSLEQKLELRTASANEPGL